jgi:hypothetical protein
MIFSVFTYYQFRPRYCGLDELCVATLWTLADDTYCPFKDVGHEKLGELTRDFSS